MQRKVCEYLVTELRKRGVTVEKYGVAESIEYYESYVYEQVVILEHHDLGVLLKKLGEEALEKLSRQRVIRELYLSIVNPLGKWTAIITVAKEQDFIWAILDVIKKSLETNNLSSWHVLRWYRPSDVKIEERRCPIPRAENDFLTLCSAPCIVTDFVRALNMKVRTLSVELKDEKIEIILGCHLYKSEYT